jgi:peptidoglycan/LPS O-acetylase OafA/YrhL
VRAVGLRRRNEKIRKFWDRLKGLAGFAVYMEHFITPLHPEFLRGYGQDDTTSLLQLPFIRLAYAGTSMVATFFVISGFVLSKASIDLIKEGRREEAFDKLAASIFKRGST